MSPIGVSDLQYSQKEDKYEEEIKVLTDKLKEVKTWLSQELPGAQMTFLTSLLSALCQLPPSVFQKRGDILIHNSPLYFLFYFL